MFYISRRGGDESSIPCNLACEQESLGPKILKAKLLFKLVLGLGRPRVGAGRTGLAAVSGRECPRPQQALINIVEIERLLGCGWFEWGERKQQLEVL